MSETFLALNGQLRRESSADAVTQLQRKGWTVIAPPSYNADTETVVWDGVALVKTPLPEAVAAGVNHAKGFMVLPEGFAIPMHHQARARWMEMRDDLRERIQAGKATGATQVQILDTTGTPRTVTIIRLRAILIDAWQWLNTLRASNPEL